MAERTGTLGGSNRMLSAKEVSEILGVPERTLRDRWPDWGMKTYKIGRHRKWRERDLEDWIERNAALARTLQGNVVLRQQSWKDSRQVKREAPVIDGGFSFSRPQAARVHFS